MSRRHAATMLTAIVVGGLIRKRRKLATKAKLTPAVLDELRSIDLTIRLFNPLAAIAPEIDGVCGEQVDDDTLLRLMAATEDGTTVQKLAISVMSNCNLPIHDLRIIRRVAVGVTAAVHRLADRGEVLMFHTGTSAPICKLSPLGHERLEEQQ